MAAAGSSAVVRLVGKLEKYGGLNGRDIANIVDVTPDTVSRWRKGIGAPSVRKQAITTELCWMAERLCDFYHPQEVRTWLHSAHPLLNGARPVDLVNQRRTGEVLEVIDQLDCGAFL